MSVKTVSPQLTKLELLNMAKNCIAWDDADRKDMDKAIKYINKMIELLEKD